MSATTTHTTETTERKPPTIADIVREKTGDGALIIDFFTDVMTGRIKGAELCHRIDAAKQLVKYGSKDAAEFLAKYKGVPCGHSTRGRPNQADPCSAEDRSLVAVTLNAPATLTRDFLTVLSGIDEFLMARLIRAQTADGGTIIDFLDDVMQDRNEGFKTHHRIAAAKELIVHIVRDEQPSHTPSPSTTPSPLTGEGWGEGDTPAVGADPRVRPLPGSHTPSPSTGEGGARPESPRRSEGDSSVVPAQAEGNPDNTIVVPAKSLPRRYGEPRGAGCLDPARLEYTLSPTHPSFPPPRPSFPRRREPRGAAGAGWLDSKAGIHPEPSFPPPLPSFPRKREPRGAGWLDPARLEYTLSPTRSVVPAPTAEAGTGRGVSRPSEVGAHAELNSPVVPAEAGTQGSGVARPSKAGIHPEPNSSVVPAACPVPDTGREPIPVTLSLAPN